MNMSINWKHFYSDSLLRIFVRTPHEEKFQELVTYLESNFNYSRYSDPTSSNRYKINREYIEENYSKFSEIKNSPYFENVNLNELNLEKLVLLLLKVLPNNRINSISNNGTSTLLRFYGSFLFYCLINELEDLDKRYVTWRTN